MTITESAATSRPRCSECGSLLMQGTCPACALRLLLDGPEEMDEIGDVSVSPSAAEAGERYQLKHKIASGGMGVVWAAEDRRLRRTVALKMLRGARFAEESEMARFEIEAAAAAALDHPHIVPVYEVGRLERQPFFTMKLIDGASLAERLKERGRLPAKEAALLLGKIARAVHHAHSRGVLHRDLKPGNILLDAHGEPWLTDFGLAKVTASDSGLTVSSDHLGTPHYMAPETAAGRAHDISTASDVWALGVILWEMLCGQRPFTGAGGMETMRRIVEEEPVRPSSSVRLDGDLMTLAQRCLEKSPSRRPVSAGEVADELDRWQRGEPLRARRISPSEALWKWVRRKPVLAALYAALAVGTVTGFGLWRRAEKAVISLTATNDHLNEALRVSTATKLAGDARLQVDEEPTRALLLAVAAVEMTEKTGVGILPEAASALTAVLQKVGGFDASALGVQEAYNDAFQRKGWPEEICLRISPDGRQLLSLSTGGLGKDEGARAALFGLDNEAAAAPTHRWQLWGQPTSENRCDVRWLNDSRHLLALDDTGEAVLWDTAAAPTTESTPPRQTLGSLARPGWKVVWQMLAPARPGGPMRGAAVWRSVEGPSEEMVACLEFSTPGQVSVGPTARSPVEAGHKHGYQLSPDGRWLFVCGDGQPQLVRVFALSPQAATELPPLGESRHCQSICFSRDGGLMALCGHDHTLEIFTMPVPESPAPLRKILTYTMDIGLFTEGVFSPDGRWFAVTGIPGAVWLYPTQAGREPLALPFPEGEGLSIAFSDDGRHLGVGSRGRVAYVWKMAQITSGQPPLPLRGMPVALSKLVFSKDGRSVAAAGTEGRAARRWRLDVSNEGAVPDLLPLGTHRVAEVAVSPDGRWLAAGSVAKPGSENEFTGGLVTLSSADGSYSGVLGAHGGRATGLAFSHDGRWLASTGQDTSVKIWDLPVTVRCLEAGQPLPPAVLVLSMAGTRPHFDRTLAFHPRGTLYGACGDGILFEWELTAPDPVASVQRHAIHSILYLLPDVKISPDGRWMAVARHGWDKPGPDTPQGGNQVLLYDVAQPGPPVLRTHLTAHFLGETRLSFSPDSRWLAAGSGGYPPDLWDLRATDVDRSRRSAPVPRQTPATAFSPDGRWLALGGDDGSIHLWDWRQGTVSRSIQTSAGIKSLAWLTPDRLVSAGDDDHLAIWDFNASRLKTLARRIAGRELGAEERKRFQMNTSYR